MTDFRQNITDPVCEQTTATLTLALTDENDLAIAKAQLTSLTLSLYRAGYPEVFFNGRDASDILDSNGGTVSADGVLTLLLENDDNVLASQGHNQEFHVALIRWTWDSGSRQGVHEVTYRVVNQAAMA